MCFRFVFVNQKKSEVTNRPLIFSLNYCKKRVILFCVRIWHIIGNYNANFIIKHFFFSFHFKLLFVPLFPRSGCTQWISINEFLSFHPMRYIEIGFIWKRRSYIYCSINVLFEWFFLFFPHFFSVTMLHYVFLRKMTVSLFSRCLWIYLPYYRNYHLLTFFYNANKVKVSSLLMWKVFSEVSWTHFVKIFWLVGWRSKSFSRIVRFANS